MPLLNKTVFVLDHTPYFGIASENSFDFEFLKSRLPNSAYNLHLPPISKSLWTCSVESCIEYCRIVWDLFPEGKLIRFVISDNVAHILNTWSPLQQNIGFIINAMAVIGVPPRGSPGLECSVVHGLRAAIEAMAEPSPEQKARLDQKCSVSNRCRLICLTSARDDASMKSLEDIFQSVLKSQNKIAMSSDQLLTIQHCHLVIINVYPCKMVTQVSNRAIREISSQFSSEVHSVPASHISNKLSHLILGHYDLASTTVTGIPMKEELNASTSANYDVEIYHSSSAHSTLSVADVALLRGPKEGADYLTTTLKWSTPRGGVGGPGGSSELQPCSAQHRITPVDVNARPSTCLVNFLLNGRAVTLEMPKKSGGRLWTHLLAAHGGEIFIHSLSTGRSVLEDPPSISEGGGGRVTDYRINDFGAFMIQNKLVPLQRDLEKVLPPLSMALIRLNRQTNSWPLTLSSTLIYNLRQHIDPLPQLISKEVLTEDEVLQCKKVIYNLVGFEAKNDVLPLSNVGLRMKGQKREDQWRSLWDELENLIRASGPSSGHSAVLHCLLECRQTGSPADDKVELDRALRELDELSAIGSATGTRRTSVIRATTDSPMSPPHNEATSISNITISATSSNRKSVYAAPKNLLEMTMALETTSKRMDFSGRILANGGPARLYPNLKDDKPQRGEIAIE